MLVKIERNVDHSTGYNVFIIIFEKICYMKTEFYLSILFEK